MDAFMSIWKLGFVNLSVVTVVCFFFVVLALASPIMCKEDNQG